MVLQKGGKRRAITNNQCRAGDRAKHPDRKANALIEFRTARVAPAIPRDGEILHQLAIQSLKAVSGSINTGSDDL